MVLTVSVFTCSKCDWFSFGFISFIFIRSHPDHGVRSRTVCGVVTSRVGSFGVLFIEEKCWIYTYCFLRIDSNKVRRIRRRTRSKCVAAVSEHKVKVEVRESVVSRWQKGRSRGEKNENISTKTGATPKTKGLLPPTKSWCGHSAWSNLSRPSPGGDSSAQCSSIISGVCKNPLQHKSAPKIYHRKSH